MTKSERMASELTKKRSRRYPAKTITDADYADDIAILANTPDQAETLLYSLERAVAGIGLYVNAHKTECMCYNQTGDISTLEVYNTSTQLFANSGARRDGFMLFQKVLDCPRGVLVKAMDCGIVVREFVLQSRYYVHFRANTLGKGMNPLISLQLWVNSRAD